MIVLDASVLIAYLDGADRHHATAVSLLASAIDEEVVVNPLTLAEVLVVPARLGRLEPTQAALLDLEVREQPFPADASVTLAQLRVTTGLKMPDCCVLLAAQDSGATLASFDDRLAHAAATIGLTVLRS